MGQNAGGKLEQLVLIHPLAAEERSTFSESSLRKGEFTKGTKVSGRFLAGGPNMVSGSR